MKNDSIDNISLRLQKLEYLTEMDPKIPGVQALLYARSARPVSLGFAKVDEHFLFVDWENAIFGRLNLLKETYRRFSEFVNLGIRVPHAFRMRIPSLVVVAVSNNEFPPEVIEYVRMTYLSPWYGGEAGQLMLVDLQKGKLFTHRVPKMREPGSLPLSYAVVMMKKCFE